ncbi:curli production assembly/transport protein CsgG [Microbulbifer thermotolerans]|uniref:Curli production assembly/transport component CsgG n=1 Tax=Microbulbifer thermotolerans TaxID=252514 RepID=A0AB35I0X1_MICTH|nr:CsgG/HfaB family protein [Microbulbifer thermotolerans]MCX2781224.1 curli production assembly/transport protein CsgG [Microbulbifer thermotolerans]MCX2783416.1 curli production assembly/transport protein CsgG [Microbulbifer thermotolerans]MCX2793451.1 curli production assembly/transport protein CsgG [Microbulbifer thermotolerans]MCX2802898.1 curli production assembly/transport protein CsgG [Microbulbifer thermotolerans]MCX2803747.1 curli production assembly/transport protein CsgG [Microbulb
MRTAIRIFALPALALIATLSGCTTVKSTGDALFGPGLSEAQLTPRNSTYRDLLNLPTPKGKILAAVYSFRDQTGQYKPSPNSSFSTAVTQGGASMLMDVLNESGWFIPLEREGLQNLLTERKIIRAAQAKPDAPANNNVPLPSLVAANILLEGGIVAYDTNIRTGGAGARYFGIGLDDQYRVDQVTVNLRAVDIRSGRVLHSVLTSKTVYSKAISADVYRFVSFRRLLELEAGTTTNEPAQLAMLSAMESAVIHLIAEGIVNNSWALANPDDINNPVLQYYLNESTHIM